MTGVHKEIEELLSAVETGKVSVREFQRRLELLFNQYPAPVERDTEAWFVNVINDLERALYTKSTENQLAEAKRIAGVVRKRLKVFV